MQLHVARQPIFNKQKQIVAYELLHRDAPGSNAYMATDGNAATSSVITSAFLSFGLDLLTGDTLAYVNFTTELLLQCAPLLLPRDQLVTEILETVQPTEEVLQACRTIKAAGYKLALDDFVLRPGYDELIDLAGIIKVDFRISDADEQRAIIDLYKDRDISFLAEKVETEAEFARAVKMGYHLFQGYFFARPVTLSTNAVPSTKLGYVQLMQAVHEDKPDFSKIIRAIESDVAFSLDTIKLVNSAYFARRHKISSVKDAVIMLGLEGVRKWVNVSVMSRLAWNKPDVLISHSLVRSRFMELMARRSGRQQYSSEYSMLGLFSLLDALIGCTFKSLFSNLNLSDTVKSILIDSDYSSDLGKAYCLMLAYEQGEWDKAGALCPMIGLSMDDIAQIYMDALEWHSNTVAMNKAAQEA